MLVRLFILASTVILGLAAATRPAIAGECLGAFGRDKSSAVEICRAEAEQGDASAQLQLGLMFYLGEGVAKNCAEAVKWYRKAAEQNNSHAQLFLGQFYQAGLCGIRRDYVTAYMLFELSAAQGNPWAQISRNELSNQMTRQNLARAERLAAECAAKSCKGCGF